jgi:hypothetical protein
VLLLLLVLLEDVRAWWWLRRRRRRRLLCLRRTSCPRRLALTPKGQRGPGAGGVSKEKSLLQQLSEDEGDLNRLGMGEDIIGGSDDGCDGCAFLLVLVVAVRLANNAGRLLLAQARSTPGCGFGDCGAAPSELV